MISFTYVDNVADYVQNIESFTLFNEGQKRNISKGNEEFDKILKNVKELFLLGRIMPAFGVSLHTETLNALNKDLWLQLNFNEEKGINGLPFNALLFKLETTGGINLIRLYNGKYEGRCIYLDFDKFINLRDLLDIIN